MGFKKTTEITLAEGNFLLGRVMVMIVKLPIFTGIIVIITLSFPLF
jgi:hypothetical protein